MHLYYTVIQLIKQVNYQHKFTVRWRLKNYISIDLNTSAAVLLIDECII